MREWTADFGNDPDDDYNLVLIIYYKDEDVALIKQTSQGLTLTWYPQEKLLSIPVEWLSKLLMEAKRSLTEEV